MSQFQNEAFQFDFVPLVQTLSQSVVMATDLSFHFMCKLLYILESFISSKSILIICSQVIHTQPYIMGGGGKIYPLLFFLHHPKMP